MEHVAAMHEPEEAAREDRLVIVAVERVGAGGSLRKEAGVQDLRAGEDEGRGLRPAAPAEPPVVVAEEVTRAVVAQRAGQGQTRRSASIASPSQAAARRGRAGVPLSVKTTSLFTT